MFIPLRVKPDRRDGSFGEIERRSRDWIAGIVNVDENVTSIEQELGDHERLLDLQGIFPGLVLPPNRDRVFAVPFRTESRA
ncbi:MAG: hypothetical protein ACRYG8_50695 [Janthinobacterium lividum]